MTATGSVNGNTVNITVRNSSSKSIGCTTYGLTEGVPFADGTEIRFGSQEQLLIQPGQSHSYAQKLPVQGPPPGPYGSTTIPDGRYDVYWGCFDLPDRTESWGTNPPVNSSNDAPTDGIAQVIKVSVPGTAQPPTPPCTGSLCMFEDLFG